MGSKAVLTRFMDNVYRPCSTTPRGATAGRAHAHPAPADSPLSARPATRPKGSSMSPHPFRRMRRAGLTMLAAITLTAGSMATAASASASPVTHVRAAPPPRTPSRRPRARPDRRARQAPVRGPGAPRRDVLPGPGPHRRDGHQRHQPLAAPSGYGPSRPAERLRPAVAARRPARPWPSSTPTTTRTPSRTWRTYRSQYGLPACTTANGCFKKVNQTGGTSYPTRRLRLGREISLDLDMVSAVCPQCHILLVEATSPTMDDLGTAVNTRRHPGRQVRLQQLRRRRGLHRPQLGRHVLQPPRRRHHRRPPVTTATASEYPAASQYVTAVGGTSLSPRSQHPRLDRVASWSPARGRGSGCSAYDAKPSWQTDTGCAKRTDRRRLRGRRPEHRRRGLRHLPGQRLARSTAAPAPRRRSSPASTRSPARPAAGTYPASYPYAHTGALNDVTTGSNGSCSAGLPVHGAAPATTARPAWAPRTASAAFAGGAQRRQHRDVTNPGNQTTQVGTAVSLQIHASDSASGQTLTYSATGLPAGLSIKPPPA